MRRTSLVVIAGTGTEVGKTWLATRYLSWARSQGITVAARKPVQSFHASPAQATDAQLLAEASGETPHVVCPPHRWYPLAMAPPMAADVLNRSPIRLDELI